MKFFCKSILIALLSLMTITGCKKSNQPKIQNKDKPLIYFGIQPMDLSKGTLDMNLMNWNDKTYYIGCDALRGGFVQAKMIKDFLESSDPAKIDRNGDGVIGYVLCIGDSGHKDSRGRTEAVRKTLDTWNGTHDAKDVKDGKISINGKDFIVRELDAKVMTGTDGSTWNPAIATESMSNWVAKLGNEIDLVISNNDTMAMGCLQISNYPAGLPIFGYDAVADAVEAVEQGKLTGTVSQDPVGQVAIIYQLLRNIFDGLSGEDVINCGISKPDQFGNKINATALYIPEQKSFFVESIPVTKENLKEFKEQNSDKNIKQATSAEKKILFSTYSSSDLFQTVILKSARLYEPLFNYKVTYITGDGYSESSTLDKFMNIGKYDAFVIGMLRENSGYDYMDKLKY
ncbi:MAG: substrate-binding domain-containing protein [Treponema sp.]|nr:substrate-binding domain-containing protein [Treponema sp.]